MRKKSVTVAKTAGFCYGVKRAVGMAYDAVGKYRRIYTYGSLIHNRNVVSDLEARGVEVIDSLDGVTDSDAVIIRSHV